jgi:hypothetical protein
MATDRTELERMAAESTQKVQQAKDLAIRDERAARVLEENTRQIKVEQEKSRRIIEKVTSIVRNATTSSGGPPMATLERVHSLLGSMGTANAIGQSIKKGDASQFLNTYAEDVVRGFVQATTGTRMGVPGGRVEGVDLARMMGAKGGWAKAAGIGIEMATDPTTFGKGPIAPVLSYTGKGISAGMNIARRIPGVNSAYTGVARSLNKFHDIDQLPNAQAIKDAFQAGLDASGNVDITKLVQSMKGLATPGGTGTRLPSLAGKTFQQPVAELLEKEWQATFLNFNRNTPSEKILGGMKTMTTEVKKAVTVIDPIFHVRNFLDGIYKNILEKVTIGDYRTSRKLLASQNPTDKLFRQSLAEKGIIGQSGVTDVKGGWVGSMAEILNNNVRLPLAMRTMRKGGSMSEAGTLVNQTHIDYRAAMNSPLINALSNRFVPFAKYEAGNPWSYLSSMPRYSGRMSMAEKVQRNTEDEKDPWKIPPGDRGRYRFGGWTGAGTSFEDLASIGDKGPLNRLMQTINPLIKLIAEKTTGWDSWRGRPLNKRESGKKFTNMPSVFKDAMDMRMENGRETISGPSLHSLSVFSRGIGMGANYANAAEGSGSWLSSLSGIRRPLQQPWMVDQERRNTKTGGLWSGGMPWTAEAQAANRDPNLPLPRIADNMAIPVKMVAMDKTVLDAWAGSTAGARIDPNFKDETDTSKYRNYYGGRFQKGNVSGEEKARQQDISDQINLTKMADIAGAKVRPLGQQTRGIREAEIAAFQKTAYYKSLPADEAQRYVTNMRKAGDPISMTIDQAKQLQATQGGQDEGLQIRKTMDVLKSFFSFLSEQTAKAMPEGLDRISREGRGAAFGQKQALLSVGINLNDPRNAAYKEQLETVSSAATDQAKLEWQQQMVRAGDKLYSAIADAEVNPITKLELQGKAAVNTWLHSKDAIGMTDNNMGDAVIAIADAIAQGTVQKINQERTKLLQAESAQLEAYFKEKATTASAILKQTFESGQTGITSYFTAQRNSIQATTGQSIATQTGLLGMAGKSIQGSYFLDSMTALAQSGNFEELNKNREAMQNAGVDVEVFFKAAAEIAQIIAARSKQIADLAVSEKTTKDQYDSALTGLTSDTAGTWIKTRETSLSGPTLNDLRGNFVTQFDADTEKKRIDMSKTLNYSPLSPSDIDEKDPKDLENYYKSKAALEANDEAREQLRTESLAKIDRDFWLTKCKQAQTGVDALQSLATALYEFSGKKSKEAFYMMKAASIATAMVKGYESAVGSFAAGSSIGGPYVGAAFAAISIAATTAQIANIVAQEMAKGGPVVGGSGTKDDVPIMGMGGEYMMQKKAVNKYGVNFMNAINEGKAEPRDFVIPSVPSRSHFGSSYAGGGLISAANGADTTIILENKTNQNMKMSDGGMKFDGKKMVRSIVLDLVDTDPQFASMFSGGR